MEKHASAVLDAAEKWNWPAPSCMNAPGPTEDTTKALKFKLVCRRFLLSLVMESHRLGGSLLELFWSEVERCHPQLPENVQELRRTAYSSVDDSVQTLFDDVDLNSADFSPVFRLAADLFTHIGLAFMNFDDRRKVFSPPPTFSSSPPSSRQQDDVLKVLVMKRDGTSCPFSEIPYYGLGGIDPTLIHVIPSSVHSKPDTLHYVSVIAGKNTLDKISQLTDTIDNVLASEASIAASHRLGYWGLEAYGHYGDDNHATYYFTSFEPEGMHKVGSVIHRNGDQIFLGQGPEGTQYRNGPNPLLCNLRFAVGRALYTSGAATFISQLMDDADDIDCPHVAFKDKDFHDVLSAKLLICGRAQMV